MSGGFYVIGDPVHAHMALQLFRAVTGIGALLEEGVIANSRRDMAAKYAIALREARESNFWSRLIARDPNWTGEVAPVIQETKEFVAMLTVSVRKLRAGPDAGQRAPSSSLCPLPFALCPYLSLRAIASAAPLISSIVL
jgi:four helix bundle protein